MTIEQERLTPTQEDREAAAKALGYKDWGDATDYRLTGEQDRQAAAMVEHFARHRLAALKSPPIAGGEGVFAITDEVVAYIQRYGGRCRDCADYDGACPGSGLPCGESGKAVRWVLKALNYGLSHGFVTLEPAPDLSKPTTSGDVGKLCERLRASAQSSSHVQQMMAEAKSLRNSDGKHNDSYMWPAPEQTLEGQAATLLTQMEARESALREVLETAESALDQLLDDMGETGQCVCPAAKFEAIDALADVRRALLTGAGS